MQDVGYGAINDGLILENQIFTLLRANFEGDECYNRLVSFVFDLLYVTERGQLLDVRSDHSSPEELLITHQ